MVDDQTNCWLSEFSFGLYFRQVTFKMYLRDTKNKIVYTLIMSKLT